MDNVGFGDKVSRRDDVRPQIEVTVFFVFFRRPPHIDGQAVFESQDLAEAVALRRQIAVAGYKEIECQLFKFGAAQKRCRFECGS